MPQRRSLAVYLGGVAVAATLVQQCQGFLPPTPARSLTQGNAFGASGWRRCAIEPEESAGIGFATEAKTQNKGKAKTGTVNKRLLNVIDSELKEVRAKNPQPPPVEDDASDDLNGINPLTPLSSAAFAGFISFLFWRITIGLATAFNNVHLETDFYPAQRLFNIASTAFVGITALGAGVIGVTAVGLLGLTMRVTLGIMSGELDPNKQRVEAPRPPFPVDSQGLPKITGAWYDVKPTPPPVQPEPPAEPSAAKEGVKEKQDA